MTPWTKPETRERLAQKTYGCTAAELAVLNEGMALSDLKSKAYKYLNHKKVATTRGIPWEISFPEWVSVWVESGRWNERGPRKHEYVMARRGDEGPYKVGNVFIQTARQNSAEAAIKMHRLFTGSIRKPKNSRGWSYLAGRRKPYEVRVAKKTYGSYATQAEAEAVYHAVWEARLAAHAAASMVKE